MNLHSWKSQPKITSAYSPLLTLLENKDLNAEVGVTNFLVQHHDLPPLATADHLGQLAHCSNLFLLITKLLTPMAVLDKIQVLLLMKLFNHIVTTILLSFARTIPVVLLMMDRHGSKKDESCLLKNFNIKRSKTVSSYFFDMYLTEG